jgi:hypothetical protein
VAGLDGSPTARIGRGPSSDSPTSPEGVGRLFFTARIERPPPYRGGSASKKNGLPAPSHSSETARCTSTGDPLVCPLILPPSSLAYIFKDSLVDPRVRASNEHILIVRVPRAGGRPGCPSLPSPWLPRTKSVQQFRDEIISVRQEHSGSKRSHAHCDGGSSLHAFAHRDRLRDLQPSFCREAGDGEERLFELLRQGSWVRVPAGSPRRTVDRTFKATFSLFPPA